MKLDSHKTALLCLMLGPVAAGVLLLRIKAEEQPLISAPTSGELAAFGGTNGAHSIAAPRSTEHGPQVRLHPPIPTLDAAIRAQKTGRTKAFPIESPNPIAERPHRQLVIQTFPTALVPGQPATAGLATPSELHIELSPGVREPLALTADASELPPPQVRAVDGIANDFADRIEQAADALSEDEFAATWNAEQANADAQYYALFGVEAFNRKMADVAAEAITGKPVERDGAAPK